MAKREGWGVFNPAHYFGCPCALSVPLSFDQKLRRGAMTSVLLLVASIVFSEDQVKPPPGLG